MTWFSESSCSADKQVLEACNGELAALSRMTHNPRTKGRTHPPKNTFSVQVGCRKGNQSEVGSLSDSAVRGGLGKRDENGESSSPTTR